MKKVRRLFYLTTLWAGLAAGCATVAETPTPRAPSAFEPLVKPHRDRAADLTGKGRLREALESWKVALTIDPKDAVALEERRKLEERIKQTTAERMARGQEALKRGAHLEARSHFLAVLALDPSNRDAFSALQTEVREVRQLNHTVRAGESLASIAQQYYGDRSRSEVIWETNQLPPNPKLSPGTVLRIPEIPGLPFGRQDGPVARPRPDGAAPAPKAEPVEETPAVNPALAEAKEALAKGEYSVALSTVDQFLVQNPRSTEAVEVKRDVLFQQGKALLDQNRLTDSFAALTQLARLSPRDNNVNALLGKVRGRLVQQHYNQGIRLYREEKLPAAINEWRTVLQYDANHEGAKKNIETAERLLKGLQERQQKRDR
ncbi:MAG TPA: LysM peptidoglycan-binding domain-containing protein [Candidatus Binatia bacterium]|nr:LysM peptidoglycan-binding domain-containing protein [Candidatus Binatia bacterium]